MLVTDSLFFIKKTKLMTGAVFVRVEFSSRGLQDVRGAGIEDICGRRAKFVS